MLHATALLVEDAHDRVLFIRRSAASRRFAGWWEFPGGKIDPGEDAATAAAREAREETGLDVPAPDPARGETIPTAGGEVAYTFFAVRAPAEAGVRLSGEHAEHAWLRPTEVRAEAHIMAPHRAYFERHWHRRQIERFATTRPAYEAFAATLEAILRQIQRRWSPLGVVQSRAKTLSSFAEKCLRKAAKYDNPVAQLTDLCGARVICTTADEAAAVCRQIRTVLGPVDEDEDTGRRHRPNAFGYLSVHFIVHLEPGVASVLGVPVPPQVAGLRAEIQVRTFLQHAHAEVTHDRLYKCGFDVPAFCEREASRTAALLESADLQFAAFVHRLDTFTRHYAAHQEPAARLREIRDLQLVLAHEPDARKRPALALRIARLCRAGWDWAGVVAALEPFAADADAPPALRAELGNALCELPGNAAGTPGGRRGIHLLDTVALPRSPAAATVEADDRMLRAAALCWLGSALARESGRRADARRCLGLALELEPDDPYLLAALVELELHATTSWTQLGVLTPALRQAAGRCEEHARAGIEVTRAWMTLAVLRLLVGDDLTGAVEALALGARSAEGPQPLLHLLTTLGRLDDAANGARHDIRIVLEAARLLAEARATNAPAPAPAGHVLVVAGATAEGASEALARFAPPLAEALRGFVAVVTGGTSAGVCGLVADAVARARADGATIVCTGYLPRAAAPGRGFDRIVRTDGADFSLLEPVAAWRDLLEAGRAPGSVQVVGLGGGDIAAQELLLAWALGAQVGAVDLGDTASARLRGVLERARNAAGGIVAPDDPATVAALVRPSVVADPARWDDLARTIHERYVAGELKKPGGENLKPWTHLREDFRDSNRQQAAFAAGAVERRGFRVRRVAEGEGEPEPVVLTVEDVDFLAEQEHGRWNIERLRAGWRWGPEKDAARRITPHLVPWRDLPEGIRDYDRQAVRNWPELLAHAGYSVERPLS